MIPRIRVAAVAVIVAVAVGAGLAVSRSPEGVEGALEVLRDDSNFQSPRGAGESLARVADLLFADGKACAQRRGDQTSACVARLRASAHAHVAALRVLRCTLPDAHDARGAVLAAVEAIERVDRDPDQALPELHRLPDC